MASSRPGGIISAGSHNEFMSLANVTAGVAARDGALPIMKSLKQDFRCHGIRVNGIVSGGTDTPRMLQTIADAGNTHDERIVCIPIRRRASVDEIAAVSPFLAVQDASDVHDPMLVTDGGWSCD